MKLNDPQFQDLSRRLKAASDELNEQLRNTEKQINEAGIGVEIWLPQSPLEEKFFERESDGGDPTRVRVTSELGYAKSWEGWALTVREVRQRQRLHQVPGNWEWTDEGTPEPYDPKPLLRASRSLRMAAVDLLPALIEELYNFGTRMMEAVEKARAMSKSV